MKGEKVIKYKGILALDGTPGKKICLLICKYMMSSDDEILTLVPVNGISLEIKF